MRWRSRSPAISILLPSKQTQITKSMFCCRVNKYKNSDHLLVETPRFPGLWPGGWTWQEIFKDKFWYKYSLAVLFARSNTWVLPSRPDENIDSGVYVCDNLYSSSLHSQWHWPPSKEGKCISPRFKGPLPNSLLVGPPSPVPHPPTGHKMERELKPSLEALGKHRLGDYFGET